MPVISRIGAAAARGFGLFGLTALKDAFFNYVTLLLPGNGTNGAQNNTFLDSSTNNFTITRNGNTTQGTFAPYGANWSNYCTSSSGYLSVGSSAALASSTNSFTLEFWYNSTSTSNGRPLGNGTGGAYGANNWVFASNNAAGKLEFYVNNYNAGAAMFSSTSSTVSYDGQWHHIILVRSGTTWAFFIDGQRQGATITSSVSFNGTSSAINIGWSNVSGDVTGFSGYISNVRFVNGTAVYDPTQSTITVPTAPLTAITNTQLLTCQSNRFIDNSSNAFTITRNGSPSVQRFSPFSPTAAYSASTIGGSGYFDGSGDYLTCPNAGALTLGSGNWTIETWVYLTSTSPSYQGILDWRPSATQFYPELGLAGATFTWYMAVTGNMIQSSTININTWYHVAVCKSGSSTKMFLNGVQTGSTYTDTNTYVSANPIRIGNTFDNFYLFGYMMDTRVIVGSALYTANFTPPTAPLTAITNTALLLNYTNAGVIDNAMMNDLETVGNAQISTTQSKFGGSSMYFDGTGDWLYGSTNPNLSLGSANFTMELWMYHGTGAYVNTQPVLLQNWSTTWAANYWSFHADHNSSTAGKFTLWIYNNSSSVPLLISTSTSKTSTWNHVAIVRNGNTFTMYVNGTSEASATFTGSMDGGGSWPIYVGGPNQAYDGYIQGVRITKGIARYTANFSVPTAAFPVQ